MCFALSTRNTKVLATYFYFCAFTFVTDFCKKNWVLNGLFSIIRRRFVFVRFFVSGDWFVEDKKYFWKNWFLPICFSKTSNQFWRVSSDVTSLSKKKNFWFSDEINFFIYKPVEQGRKFFFIKGEKVKMIDCFFLPFLLNMRHFQWKNMLTVFQRFQSEISCRNSWYFCSYLQMMKRLKYNLFISNVFLHLIFKTIVTTKDRHN